MEVEHQSRTEPQALPAFAAVMASALLLSVAMAGGAIPGLGSMGAVQAVLRSTGPASLTSIPDPGPVLGSGITAARGWVPSGSMAPASDHDRFLASAPSGPGHADLPPPTV